jgi:hypothetical protein
LKGELRDATEGLEDDGSVAVLEAEVLSLFKETEEAERLVELALYIEQLCWP